MSTLIPKGFFLPSAPEINAVKLWTGDVIPGIECHDNSGLGLTGIGLTTVHSLSPPAPAVYCQAPFGEAAGVDENCGIHPPGEPKLVLRVWVLNGVLDPGSLMLSVLAFNAGCCIC